MKEYIENRAIEIGNYIVDTGATVRAAAKKFRVSKSTVHKDMSQRLAEISPSLAHQVASVLQKNLEERHIRGGMATQLKYSHKKPAPKGTGCAIIHQ